MASFSSIKLCALQNESANPKTTKAISIEINIKYVLMMHISRQKQMHSALAFLQHIRHLGV